MPDIYNDNDHKVFGSCSILLKNLIPEADDITFDTYLETVKIPKRRIFGFYFGTDRSTHRDVKITVSSGDIKVAIKDLPVEMLNSICDCNEIACEIKERISAAKFLKDKKEIENA